MQPGKTSITQLFNAQAQYLIPVFQRGYVWALEKQVAPLWADIEDRALKFIERSAESANVPVHALKPLQKHFLGSVVLTPVTGTFGRVAAFEVIDGQQRTTTLHLLLLAFRHAAMQVNASAVPAMLDSLVRNPGPYTEKTDHFKVWPTQAGRSEMRALDGATDCLSICQQYPVKEGKLRLERPLMIQSYLYLYHACLAFLQGIELGDPVSEESDRTHSDCLIHDIRNKNVIPAVGDAVLLQPHRAEALYMALTDLVQIMTLTLEAEDDPQVIFETLNARGEPLLASDLVRNFVFLDAARRGQDVGSLYETRWRDFDEQRDQHQTVSANRYWREKVRQGRITYPRIDLFFFHYTVLRRGQETKVSHVFQGFKDWWQGESRDIDTELARVVQSSRHFRELISPDGDDYLAEFARLVRVLDVSTLTPAYLALRERYSKTDPELKQAVGDLASYITRRAICGFTTKGYNRIFLRLLTEVVASDTPAESLRSYLLKLSGHSQCWPTDAEFSEAWLSRPVYELLRPGKVSAVLRAVELASRTSRQETTWTPQIETLTVEHVMPQSWQKTTYYTLPDDDQAMIAARKVAVQSFGNLTLLTQPLNSSVSNGPFADRIEGENTVAGKRTKFLESLLLLNAYFQHNTVAKWDDEEISKRGQHLLGKALKIWSRP
ncbi:DUF262 domain-containing protein [Paraburkholderia domus]|uniref:DUF262 domain-containing protein n=1 Tax=Paraburkholderia domus TaxID=2793075 RepID=UPI001B0B21E5|nr:DUF262 domain-containing protein [Paraburkholderia domus]CAE6768520.1 hypothetical protein R75483_03899 [Paraburkholderia domus]